jgi:hypothetical protein
MAEMIRNEVEDSRSQVLPAEAHARHPWTAPQVRALRAGLAESGPKALYDGVEGTS